MTQQDSAELSTIFDWQLGSPYLGLKATAPVSQSTSVHNSTRPQGHRSTSPQVHRSKVPQVHRSTGPQFCRQIPVTQDVSTVELGKTDHVEGYGSLATYDQDTAVV